MEPSTSAGFVLKLVEYFGDVGLYELLNAVRKLEKNTGICVYSWRTDYKKRLNSADYWDDIAKLKNSGFIEQKDEKVEITERGKRKIRKTGLELQEDAKGFLEENYWRNLLCK